MSTILELRRFNRVPSTAPGADSEHNNSTSAPPLPQGEARCDCCGNLFTPRSQSGGKPQRFCSIECRRVLWAAGFSGGGFHAAVRGGYVDLSDGSLAENFD